MMFNLSPQRFETYDISLYLELFLAFSFVAAILYVYFITMLKVLDFIHDNLLADHNLNHRDLLMHLVSNLVVSFILLVTFVLFLVLLPNLTAAFIGFDAFGQPFGIGNVMLLSLSLFLLTARSFMQCIFEISDCSYALYYLWQGKSAQWIAIYRMSQQLRHYDWI